jgi:four helix bundle protein
MTFNHEKLEVYQRALTFNTRVSSFTSTWDSKHSVQDHLPRAASSIVENIAMGSVTTSGMKAKSLDYALGSTLECAACLDIASIKQIIDETSVLREKMSLASF